MGDPLGKLDGRTAIVTGGASGMGAAAARALAAEGALVAIADIDPNNGAVVAGEIGGSFVELDVASEEGWTSAVDAVETDHGAISILVNNAGVSILHPVQDTPTDAWDTTYSINVRGAFFGIRAVVPSMRKAGGGVIVNNSSGAALAGFDAMAAYSSSKWALRGLTRCAALDLAPDNIRVLSIHPGLIRTPMASHLPIDELARELPIPRPGEVDEIAKAILFAVAEATYSTGCEIIVDGGRTTGFPRHR